MEFALSADSSWNRWHPSYEELGQRCERLDVHALELAYYPDNAGFANAAETLASYDVRIVCINATAKWRVNIVDDPREAQRNIVACIQLAADVDAEYVVIYLGHNPNWRWKETVDFTRSRLDPCITSAVDKGVTLLLENHFDLRNEDPQGYDVVRDPDLTALFLESLRTTQVRLNFDPGNLYTAGFEPWPYAYQVLREYIVYAHLKDMARFSEEVHGPLAQNETLADSQNGIFLPVALGDGAINYWGLLQEMERDGIVKYATLEDHSLPQNAERYYERGLALARQSAAALAAKQP
jgi:sugar phosphate isomerase/epimerase